MLLTLAAGTVLLGVLVFVHELGHFLVAKACGVRVLVFSLGFGPRLFGFRRGDTDYRVSALPLGGYVRMYGDDPSAPVPLEERKRSFLDQPYFRRCAIAFAGPAFNFVFPVLLIAGYSFGQEEAHTTLIGSVLPESPASRAGLLPGDRIVAIDDDEIAYFDELQAIVEARPDSPMRVVVERAGARQTLELTSGSSLALSPLERGEKRGRLGVMPGVQSARLWVQEGSAAASAGLKSGDTLKTVDNKPLSTAAAFRALEEWVGEVEVTRAVEDGDETVAATFSGAAPMAHAVEIVGDKVVPDADLEVVRALVEADLKATHARGGVALFAGTIGKILEESVAARLNVEVGDRVVAVDGTRVHLGATVSQHLLERPDALHVVGLVTKDGRGRVLAFALEPERGKGREVFKTFGAIPDGSGVRAGEIVTREVGVVDAFKRGLSLTYELTEASLKGFWMLISGQVSLRSLGGPIMIVGIAGDAARAGVSTFFKAMAFISVNLAIVNLLPIPVLDGGHLMIFTIEAVQRRRLSLKVRERVTIVGLGFLVVMLVFAVVNDLIRALG